MVALESCNPLRLLTSILHRFDTGATGIESAGAIPGTGPGHRVDFRAPPLFYTNPGAVAIEKAIRDVNTTGRPALSAFLTAGFPDCESFAPLLSDVAAEADLVEIGVPFSDPMADGVTIQRSSRVALEAGVTLSWILDAVEQLPATASRSGSDIATAARYCEDGRSIAFRG